MISVAILIPVGPGSVEAFVRDTVLSVLSWCAADARVVLVDDSAGPVPRRVANSLPRTVVITVPGAPSGIRGGLYLASGLGFHAARALDPRVTLRLDSDAVIVGPEPEADAARFFDAHPDIGLLGSYRVTVTGGTRSFDWAAQQLRREASLRQRTLRDYRRALVLRRMLRRAGRHGYVRGEHALAAASFFSGPCLDALCNSGLFERRALRSSQLGDDHLTSLAVRSLGFGIEDFAADPHPLAVAWKGLPLPPEEVLRRGKKIVHSVKSYGGSDEAHLRDFFGRGRPIRNLEPLQ
jgi:hypothetical protein